MTASNAVIGYGTTFEVETTAGSAVYYKLGEVNNITPPNEKVDQVDVTHMESPNRTREFIQGLIDPGDMTVELNHIPGSATDDFIIAWRTSGEKRSCRITYPSPGNPKDTFPAFILGFTPQMGVSDAMKASLNLKVAGAIVRS